MQDTVATTGGNPMVKPDYSYSSAAPIAHALAQQCRRSVAAAVLSLVAAIIYL